MLGGCGGKKEDAADSGLPEIVIGMDYFEPYSYQASDGEYEGIDVELARGSISEAGLSAKSLRRLSGKTRMNCWPMEQ